MEVQGEGPVPVTLTGVDTLHVNSLFASPARPRIKVSKIYRSPLYGTT
jgi:hypothetical protein